MFKRRFLLIVFVSGLLTAFSVQSVLPVLVWAVARQAAVYTAQSVAIGVIAKGFSATDPYVRTTATISRSRLAQNMATSLRGPRWAGLAALTAAFAGLGWYYDEDIGLHTVETDFPRNGYCAYPRVDVNSADACFAAGIKQDGYGPDWVMVQSRVTTVDCVNMPNACPHTVHSVSLCVNGLTAEGDCSRSTVAIYRYYEDSTFRKIPVPASEIEAKGLPQLAASPNTFGDMFAGANPEMLNKLLDGATIPYNATNPTPEMAQLKADFRNGLLQSIDPNAPHYVTPEQLKQIQDLVAAEDAANTDEGTIEALNEKMKQPITQAQYEESNLKTETSQAGSLEASLGAAFEPIAQLKQDNDFILDKMTSPTEPPSGIEFFKWTLPTGSCSGFSVDMSVGNGKLHTTKQVNEFCPFYDSVAHPLLFWFLNIATFLYLFWLWDRSVSDMAR